MGVPHSPDSEREIHLRQQELIAELGQLALATEQLSDVFDHATNVVAETFGTDSCHIFELSSSAEELRIRERSSAAKHETSEEGFPIEEGAWPSTAISKEAPVVENFNEDERSDALRQYANREAVCAIGATIRARDTAWGLLSIEFGEEREFSDYDIAFVRNVADIVASAIESVGSKEALHAETPPTERIVETSPVGITIVDGDGDITFANERAEEILGRSRERIRELTYDDPQWDVTHHADESTGSGEAIVDRVRRTGEAVYNRDVSVRRPDEERRWLTVNAAPLEPSGASASPHGVIFTFTDVTEERRLEAEFEEMLTRVTDAFYAVDEEFRFTHVNERAEDLLQRSESELLGETLWDLYPEAAEIDAVWDAFHTALHDQEPTSYELYYEPLEFWVEANLYPSETGVSVYFRDVTERKEREQALERTLDLLHKTQRIADVGGWEIDPETTDLFWTDHVFELLELSADEEPPLEEALEMYHEEDRPIVEGAVREAFDAGDPFDIECRIWTATGEVRWLRLQGIPKVIDGEVTSLRGAAQDITDRKERERHLERARKRVELALEATDATVWEWDYETDAVETLPDPHGLLDIAVDSVEDLRRAIHPDDRARVVNALTDALANDTPYHVEFRYSDGETIRWAEDYGEIPDATEADADSVLVGIARDITDRKERELELEQYQALTEAANDVIVTIDADSVIRSVNPAVADVFGYEPDELVGESLTRLMPPALAGRHEAALERYLETGETTLDWDYVELPGRHADDTEIPLAISFSEVAFDDERFFTGIIRDVTDRKERERKLEASEQRYRALVDQFPNGAVALFDHELQYTAAGGQLLDELYDDTDDLGGETVLERLPEGVAADLEPRFRAALAGETSEFELEVRDRHLLARTLPVRDADGDVMAGMIVVIDITERQEYLESVERFETFLQHSTDLFTVVDREGTFLYQSESARWILGYAPSELIGENAFEYIHPDDRQLARDAFEREMANGGETSSVQYRFKHADGTWRWLESRGNDQLDNPAIEGFVVNSRDITARKDSQRKLEASHERLEQFAAAVSHDLKEPLGMVTSYLQLLERRYQESLDEEGEEFIDFAVEGATRMREMIESLLTEYAQVESGGKPLEPVDLESVFEDVCSDLEPMIEESEAKIAREPLPCVQGDGTQLRQLFQNLIDNAITYSGEATPEIDISVEETDRKYIVSVSDNGIGIDPDVGDDVFDVFYRSHDEEEYPGTGIGLSLCERIVHRHDGEIWVDSTPGEGATFSFTLRPATE